MRAKFDSTWRTQERSSCRLRYHCAEILVRPSCVVWRRRRKTALRPVVSGLGPKPRPRWRYARPGPHKLFGVGRRFLNQVSRTPFDCQAISLPPLANIVSSSAPHVRRPAESSNHQRRFWRQTFGRFAVRPSRCALAYWHTLRHRDILMDTAEQTLRPSAKCGVLFRNIGQCRSCSMDQQLAQVLVSSLADPHESWLAAGRRLTRNQAQPCRKIATMFESLGLANGCNQSRRNRHADTRNRYQSPSIFVLLRLKVDLKDKHKSDIMPALFSAHALLWKFRDLTRQNWPRGASCDPPGKPAPAAACRHRKRLTTLTNRVTRAGLQRDMRADAPFAPCNRSTRCKDAKRWRHPATEGSDPPH